MAEKGLEQKEGGGTGESPNFCLGRAPPSLAERAQMAQSVLRLAGQPLNMSDTELPSEVKDVIFVLGASHAARSTVLEGTILGAEDIVFVSSCLLLFISFLGSNTFL